jgi:hypothetical protein
MGGISDLNYVVGLKESYRLKPAHTRGVPNYGVYETSCGALLLIRWLGVLENSECLKRSWLYSILTVSDGGLIGMQAQLIAVIAESHKNLNALRDLEFLPHKIASIAFRTGSPSGQDIYTSLSATASALRIVLHLAVQHHSLGRDTAVIGTV